MCPCNMLPENLFGVTFLKNAPIKIYKLHQALVTRPQTLNLITLCLAQSHVINMK